MADQKSDHIQDAKTVHYLEEAEQRQQELLRQQARQQAQAWSCHTNPTATGWSPTQSVTSGASGAFTPAWSPEPSEPMESPKKKQYANDLERSIDEEVRRIKNL